jgi:hypothetical protein
MMLINTARGNPLKEIVLVLNHAGDWSALINRSDTDLLVKTFSEIAADFHNLQFKIRPHPTMATPEHEGIRSVHRIKDYITWKGIKNLSVSDSSLQNDLRNGDIFVSEYSQVLIDVFRYGKLGIIANLTGRRSFMRDYERLGFLSANSKEMLKTTIRTAVNDPMGFKKLQNEAATRYNALLKEHGYC